MREQPKQKRPLRSLATIQPGYPFRGKLPIDSNGDAYVVQFRHIILGERLSDKDGKALDRVKLPGRKPPIIFAPAT